MSCRRPQGPAELVCDKSALDTLRNFFSYDCAPPAAPWSSAAAFTQVRQSADPASKLRTMLLESVS